MGNRFLTVMAIFRLRSPTLARYPPVLKPSWYKARRWSTVQVDTLGSDLTGGKRYPYDLNTEQLELKRLRFYSYTLTVNSTFPVNQKVQKVT